MDLVVHTTENLEYFTETTEEQQFFCHMSFYIFELIISKWKLSQTIMFHFLISCFVSKSYDVMSTVYLSTRIYFL